MDPDKQARDDGAVKILANLFERMCDADPDFAAPAARRAVSAAWFVGWLQNNINLVNGVTLCDDLGVPQASWDFVQQIAHSGNMQPVLAVWPRIVLGNAPPPTRPLASMHLVCLLEWEDGHMVPISMFLPRWFAPDATLTDGIAAAMLNQQVAGAVSQIVERGLDGCHEHMSDSYGGEKVFDVLMGAMLTVIPQLDPALQPYLHKWMRLFQGFVRPPVPPQVQAHIDEVKRRHAAQAAPAPRGGWNQ